MSKALGYFGAIYEGKFDLKLKAEKRLKPFLCFFIFTLKAMGLQNLVCDNGRMHHPGEELGVVTGYRF